MFTTSIAALLVAAGIVATPAPATVDLAATSHECVATSAAPQIDYDGLPRMEEDEIPAAGLFGGELFAFDAGKAHFTDGSITNGTCWLA